MTPPYAINNPPAPGPEGQPQASGPKGPQSTTYDANTGVFADPAGGTGVFNAGSSNGDAGESWVDLMKDQEMLKSEIKVATLIAAGALALAACGSSSSGGGSTSPSSSGSPSASCTPSSVKVGMAYDIGGRGDKSFNDSAAAGLDQAVKELCVTSKELSAVPNETDAQKAARLTLLAQAGYNPIIAVGFAYAASMDKVAKANPDVNFAIIDDASSQLPNLANLTFAENQGSYLVGAIAAQASKTGNIGFVGGVETDLIKKFEVGYAAGAKAVNPNIKIDSKYLTQPPDFSGFNSVDKGKAAAEGMYQGGADIVYHAAGGSGGGVFTAAKAAGKMAIGVDSDQAKTAAADVRDVIMTSMIKKVDVGVYEFIKSVHAGSFKGGVKTFDLKAGGVDYSTTGGHIDDITSKLDEYKKQIIDGTITVPAK